MMKKELVIIGGGPAGMSAAVSAYEAGVKDILSLERASTTASACTSSAKS